jgi:nitrogen regulatory protein PII
MLSLLIVNRGVETIQKYSHTCNTDGGKKVVSDVKNTVKMRTNERDEDAI